ncbi:hypothetical protein QDR37_11970 [Amnibacterium sp. CER49]|uniref:hypothetical protein n=1 Tax=Amnibacterium sp. CER49 TaxID=3039161 RepID=UPI00244A75D6|nr:hypothetical protein [Amnibacterium sp. CER49]MDH2444662.1 hypothetical protein [Amnibacterium sp. CER49]
MKGRLAFVAGLATGYVVGSRAGRQAYESLRQRVQDAAANPQVRNVLGKAKDLAEQKAPQVSGAVEGVASTVAHVAGASTSQGSSSTSSTSTEDDSSSASDSSSTDSGSGSGRGSRSRSKGSGSAAASTGAAASVATGTPTPESAQEAAEVFEQQGLLSEQSEQSEQLETVQGAQDAAAEGTDESTSPTATA